MKLIFLLLFLTYYIEISKTCGGFLPVRWNYNEKYPNYATDEK